MFILVQEKHNSVFLSLSDEPQPYLLSPSTFSLNALKNQAYVTISQ